MAKVSFTTKDGKRVSFTTKAKKTVKKAVRKLKKHTKKRNVKAKSNPGTKKSLAGKKGGSKKGTTGMTKLKKFLIGLGIGVGVSTVVGLTKVREIEFAGPLIDASVGGGVEGQLGVVLPKLIRTVLLRNGGGNGFSLFGGGGSMASEGA